MKILIEGQRYPVGLVRRVFPKADSSDVVSITNNTAKICGVGYCYNADLDDAVFVLPKVVLSHNFPGYVFGKYRPEDIVDYNSVSNPLLPNEREFIYGFSVWIYRAISVYRAQCRNAGRDHSVVRYESVAHMGSGRKRMGNSFLDILLAIMDFNRQNQDWFMFTVKNIHSGLRNINWRRTMAQAEVVIEDGEPVYLNPVVRKRQVNFDEELFVIFFSILHYIHARYGCPVKIDLNYRLITGRKFRCYLDGYGLRRLRQIKYKYFSDKALKLWDLCYAFFERRRLMSHSSQINEFLFAKDFYVVFEGMINHLIGDKELPDRLNRKQEDGKEVDHMFMWDSLINPSPGSRVYYLGDSKYYKQHHPVSDESVAKQFTYARNVIQWNLGLFFGDDVYGAPEETDFCLRDSLTEGYHVIPNFFISTTMPDICRDMPVAALYRDTLDKTRRTATVHTSQQFRNRLFDRDTLLVTHYDVNFLYVVSLYARNNGMQQREWRGKVRNLLRDKIRQELESRYGFYILTPKQGIDVNGFVAQYFTRLTGKIIAPVERKDTLLLALDRGERFLDGIDALPLDKQALRRERYEEYRKENEELLALLDGAFYISHDYHLGILIEYGRR